jgi:hypothetical protein
LTRTRASRGTCESRKNITRMPHARFVSAQKADVGFPSDRSWPQPGVAAVAGASSVPGVDAGGAVRLVTDATEGGDHIDAQSIAVTSQLADALGLAVIDGGAFTASEQADPGVILRRH